MGQLGHKIGLYLHCTIDGRPCKVLVDIESTISLIRPGVLPNTLDPLAGGWSPAKIQMMTLTREKTGMKVRR